MCKSTAESEQMAGSCFQPTQRILIPDARSIRYYPPVVAVLMMALTSLAPASNASEFTVEGQIVYKVYYANERPATMTNTFAVYVRDCSWFIRTAQAPGSSGILYYETGSDGMDIYTIQMINTNVPSIRREPVAVPTQKIQVVGKSPVALGIVAPGPVPVADLSLTTPVWLAYASECYFQSVTNHALKPVWQLDYPAILYVIPPFPADWALSEGEPHLPRRIAYFSDGKRYHWNPDSAKLLTSTNEPSPFDHGFNQCHV